MWAQICIYSIKLSGISSKRRFIWRFLSHNTRSSLYLFIQYYHACIAWASLSHEDESFSTTVKHNTIIEWNGRSKENSKKVLSMVKSSTTDPFIHFKEVKQSNLLSFCIWFCIDSHTFVCDCARGWLFVCVTTPFLGIDACCANNTFLYSQFVVSFAFTQLQTRWFSIVVRMKRNQNAMVFAFVQKYGA